MLRGSRHIIFPVLVIILILGVAAWYAQQQISAGIRKDIGASLQTVLNTTHHATRAWIKEEQASVYTWANSPIIRQATLELLEVPRNHENLVSASFQATLRKLLLPVLSTKKYQGYFVLTKDGINLASSEKENIGKQNRLLNQPFFLQKILAAESAISLPLVSEEPLPDDKGNLQKNLPTMFSGAPILDAKGWVLAIFVFRINPSNSFTNIFQRGRIGNSGETYAFNKQGWMISNSRFENELYSQRILPPGQRSMLNIRITEAATHVSNGQMRRHVNTEPQLTLMASHAIQGKSGISLDGYPDYRGVTVIGAWLWDKELDLGIATEIDAAEVNASQNLVQYTIYTLTILTIAFLSLLTAYFLVSRKKIIEGENKFRKIVDEAPFPMGITKPDNKIVHFNKKFIELFGWTIDDIRSPEDWWQKAYPDENHRNTVRGSWLSAISKAITNGTESKAQVWKTTCKNGDERDVEFRTVSVNPYFNITAARDLTEQLHAEREKEQLQRQLLQAQKMEAIGQMTGGIAHEFNNMLASIQGYAELAHMTALSSNHAKIPAYLDEVLKSSKRAAKLVAKMLAYSRSSQKDLQQHSLPDILNNALSMLKPIIPSSVVFHTEIDESLPVVLADAVELEQVIFNLCTNAHDAMRSKGSVNISLKSAVLPPLACYSCHESFDGEHIELAVTDSGEGIENDALHRIFDPFFTTKDIGKGTGMGLSMVHGIVHSHQGHIIVESRTGKGTTFKLYFPVIAREQKKTRRGKKMLLAQ